MHDPCFWQKIPEARLQNVLDHLNDRWVFDDPRTIKSIYRVLKPGGSFTLVISFQNAKHPEKTLSRRQILQDAGFNVESDDQTVFYK